MQIEPVGHEFPKMQVTENIGGAVVGGQPRASGIMVNNSANFIVTKTKIEK